jgi:hypothetical protein
MTAQPGGERRHIAGARSIAAAMVRLQFLGIRLVPCKLHEACVGSLSPAAGLCGSGTRR